MSCSSFSFMGGWNANLMARVPAAILGHEMTLQMEAEQSANTK